MAFKKYLRNPMIYTAHSMDDFVENTIKSDAKSINVIIDSEDAINRKTANSIHTHITYEANLTYRRKIEFHKYKNISQLEAIAYAGRKADWLKTKFPDKPVTIMNGKREDLTKAYKTMLKPDVYEMILKLANKTTPK